MQNRRWLQRIAVIAGIGTLVVSFQNCGKSASSASGSSTGANSTAVPLAPNQLNAVSTASSEIDLSWSDNSNNETGFKIERALAVSGGPFSSAPTTIGTYTVLKTTEANVNKYADTNLNPTTTYYYRVSAVNGAGASVTTAAVNVTTPSAPTTAPAAPSNLVATPTAATLITLTWLDNSSNEYGFSVERAIGTSTTFTVVALTSANQTNFTDYNLNPASVYSYRVRATNTVGSSTYTATASATTLAAGNMATYSYISVNILGPNCVACHGASGGDAGISYASYNATLNTVSASHSANSSLYNSINGGGMPVGTTLTASQISAIKSWIDAGALNN